MSNAFPSPFSDMAAQFRAYRRTLPRLVSGLAVSDFKANFRRQGYLNESGGVERWAPRKDGSDQGRAILIRSGRLRRGIKAAPTYTHARVVNPTPYSEIHNNGGKLKGKARVWATSVKGKNTRLRKNSGGAQAMMPARPMMVTTRPLMDNISRTILNGIEPIFKGSQSK